MPKEEEDPKSPLMDEARYDQLLSAVDVAQEAWEARLVRVEGTGEAEGGPPPPAGG